MNMEVQIAQMFSERKTHLAYFTEDILGIPSMETYAFYFFAKETNQAGAYPTFMLQSK